VFRFGSARKRIFQAVGLRGKTFEIFALTGKKKTSGKEKTQQKTKAKAILEAIVFEYRFRREMHRQMCMLDDFSLLS
jgi:hypothetical protein